VRGNECGFRMPPEKIVSLFDQLFEARKLILRISSSGKR
jgi:hypothetical protein